VTVTLPTAEAFALIRVMQRHILLAAVFLTLLAGGLTWWMLRSQLAPMLAAVKTLATLSDTNQPPQPLPIVRQDEVGHLIGGFNRLLETLAHREEALQESDARFRCLTAMSSDFYWESDIEHRFTTRGADDNDSSDVSEFAHGAQIGKRRWDLPYIAPDEAGWRAHRALLEAHLPFRNFEISRRGADGGARHISISGDPVFDAAGHFKGYAGVGADITERIRTQAELNTLSRAMEQSPASVMISDRAGNIQYVNPRFEQITGYTSAEVVGKNPRIFKSGTTPAETYADLWLTITEGGEWHGELCNRRKNGELYWEYGSISGFKDESGEVSRYIAVKEDITERKQAEAELEQHRHHLEELVVSRTSALAKANQAAEVAHRASAERLRMETAAKMQSGKLEAVGTLAAGMAHEFNNILGSIVGFAEMTADELPEDSGAQHNVAQILGASFRARDLIARMLAFARQSPVQPVAVAVDVVVQVREALAMLRASLPPAVQLSFHSGMDEADAPATVLADPTQIQQIVMNLCINAAHAMDDRGSISIALNPAGGIKGAPPQYADGVCLTVTDSGSGMTPEVLAQVFDPFFTTKAPGKGTGLGLSVVYGVVTGLGGVIEAQSRIDDGNRGTEFRVFLPVVNNTLQTGEIHGAHIAD
jgi:PAS domain S-box-containing protein